MQSQQPGAEHAQNSGDDRGLQEKPPALPPLTIMNSTVDAVESFRFRVNHIESIVKKAQQRLYFLRPAEEVQPTTGAAETVLLCHHLRFLVKSICIVNCEAVSHFRCVLCVLLQHSCRKPMLPLKDVFLPLSGQNRSHSGRQ